MRFRLTILALLPMVLCMEGCDFRDDAAIAHAVTTAELMNVRNSLLLWRELENQQFQEESVYELVSQNIVGQVLMIRAVGFDVEDLKGNSLETLCLLTTEEVKQIMLRAESDELARMAVEYVEAIEGDVLIYFRDVQEKMLGSGCSLTPGEPHF